MSQSTKYLLDANVFIEAKKRYYDFDLCPGFWEALDLHCQNGLVCSIDRIKDEIVKGNVPLATRVTLAGFRLPSNNVSVLEWYGKFQSWVQSEVQYNAGAKAEFARNADAWLIAYAKAEGCVVVTQEVPNPNIKKKVPIPNVCDAFGVPYMNTFDMLRALNTSFVCAAV